MQTSMFFPPLAVSKELRAHYLSLFSLKPSELDQVNRAGK